MSNKLKNKQFKQAKNQAQDGRSMVEMLGVLAIIGVLSIGGISGYRMAMNRYQANQIANEINLMRTDAKMKAAQGVANLMLGSPYDDEKHLNFGSNYGVDFDFIDIETEDSSETESGYFIKVSGISAGVCKPLITLLEGMDDAVAVVVNGDQGNSADLCSEESNEIEVDFSTKDIGGVSGGSSNPEEPEPEYTDPEQGDEPTTCDPDTCPGECNEEGVCECPEGSHLKGDECVSCSGGKVWDGNDCSCPAGAEESGDDGEECVCSTATPYWDGTKCTACPEGSKAEGGKCVCNNDSTKEWKASLENGGCDKERFGECESNADCGPGEYCYLYYGYSCTQEFKTDKFGVGNSDSYKSQCKKAKSDINTSGDTSSKYIISTSSMTWWSAERFCKALGRKMVTIAELECKHKIQYSGGDGTWCYCHDKNSTQTCQGGSNTELSEVVKELRRAKSGGDGSSGSGYLWLYDAYANTTSSSSSCTAYRVYLNNGHVGDRNRDSNDYALCE